MDLSALSISRQTCTNIWNASIPPGVLSFQVEFVAKIKLMEDMFVLLFWPYQIQPLPVGEGLYFISNKYMQDLCPE